MPCTRYVGHFRTQQSKFTTVSQLSFLGRDHTFLGTSPDSMPSKSHSQTRRCSRSQNTRGHHAHNLKIVSLSLPVPTAQKHFTLANEPSANDRGGFPSSSPEDYAALSLTTRSPSPSRRNQQPRSWMSPGKAAATAATAAAQEAARAAAASVKAAEAAADAAEAAEAAAEAEEESQKSQSNAFRSPPPTNSESRRHPSPARSAFWVTDGNKGGQADHGHADGSSPKSHTPRLMDDLSIEGGGGRAEERHAGGVRHRGQAGEDHGSSGRGGTEEEMLKRAREQVGGTTGRKPTYFYGVRCTELSRLGGSQRCCPVLTSGSANE